MITIFVMIVYTYLSQSSCLSPYCHEHVVAGYKAVIEVTHSALRSTAIVPQPHC